MNEEVFGQWANAGKLNGLFYNGLELVLWFFVEKEQMALKRK